MADILFIDEIHRLSKVVEEFLYPAMESFKIDFIVDKGPYAKTINFNLKPFTLIGATTRSGLLAAPLRERFGIFHHLDFYNARELSQIVANSAGSSMSSLTRRPPLRSRAARGGTPRIANRLLRRVRDYAQVKTETGNITAAVTDEALRSLAIDEIGLDEKDRKLLKVIAQHYKGDPSALKRSPPPLNEEMDTIVDVIEPYLLKIGFLKRTPRGELTQEASKHIKAPLAEKETQPKLY